LSKIEFATFNQTPNPLLNRKEVKFEILHQGVSTPPRPEVREKIAKKIHVDPTLVYIIKMETKTNTWKTGGIAYAYDSAEKAKVIVPKHIFTRDLPKEERTKLKEKKPARKTTPSKK